jgi:hypothetical protein
MTGDRWKDVSAAKLPAASLAVLAAVRADADVRVHLDGEVAWVRWPAGRDEVVRRLLPVPGVAFLARRDGLWFRFDSRLPTSDVPPAGDGRPLSSVLLPERFEPVEPPLGFAPPLVFRIVRGGGPRSATAVVCATADLQKWADTATTAELADVRAARSGSRAVLLGAKLPALPDGVRFWGDDLLVPVGFRPEPDLPASAIRSACGATVDDLVLLHDDGAELVPRAAFEPLTRAALRLALRGLA